MSELNPFTIVEAEDDFSKFIESEDTIDTTETTETTEESISDVLDDVSDEDNLESTFGDTDEIEPESFDADFEDAYDEEEDSNAAIILQQYVDDGIIALDGEIKKDLSGAELMDILRSQAREEERAALEKSYAEQGYNDNVKKAIEFLQSGGSYQELETLFANDSYSQLDISDDYDLSNRETLIKAYHREKGISDKKIEALYNLSLENDETYDDALEAQEYFREKDALILESKKIERQQMEEFVRQQELANKKHVDDILKRNSIMGLQINRQEADDIKRALYEPTEIVHYTDDHGKNRTARATKYEILLNEYANNPEWQLLFAKLLIDEFDFSKIKTKIKIERDSETLDFLNSRTINKRAIKGGQQNNRKGTNSNVLNVRDISI